jgi:hypothetical protein
MRKLIINTHDRIVQLIIVAATVRSRASLEPTRRLRGHRNA